MSLKFFDVAIIGGGPAGSVCAALCARAGLQTVILEREKFPREKVCGDCLNPSCWPILERLELAQRVRALPHAQLEYVEFVAIDGRKVTAPLSSGAHGELSMKRSLFDALLLTRAREFWSAPTAATPPWHASAIYFPVPRASALRYRRTSRCPGVLGSAWFCNFCRKDILGRLR